MLTHTKCGLSLGHRMAVWRDHATVTEIANACFRPVWTAEDAVTLLRRQDAMTVIAEVSATPGCYQSVGFYAWSIAKRHLELVVLAVRPEWRRRGIGSSVLRHLAGKLTGKRPVLAASVHEEALPVQQFLRAQGFRATKVLRGAAYGGADAYRFELRPVELWAAEPGRGVASGNES